MSEKNVMSLQVDRDAMARYIYWGGFWFWIAMILGTFGLALPFFLAWILGWGDYYSRLRAARFTAELTNKRIRITDGVYRQVVKSIPLDRITDVVQSQGILERRFGIWRLLIQTAGAGQHNVAEGTILAVRDPERQQEAIVSARNHYVESHLGRPAA